MVETTTLLIEQINAWRSALTTARRTYAKTLQRQMELEQQLGKAQAIAEIFIRDTAQTLGKETRITESAVRAHVLLEPLVQAAAAALAEIEKTLLQQKTDLTLLDDERKEIDWLVALS